MADDVSNILEEQSRYYEDRAPEYDDVWFRRGPYDLGPDGNARWFAETAALEAALDAFGATGDVLELASGTGLFTRHLAREASTLVAVDASASALEINRKRVHGKHIEHVLADVFAWQPPDGVRYDAIVFCFFISHIPPDLVADFWARIASWLKPDGRVFCCDDLAGVESRASNPSEPAADIAAFAHRRRLRDGREYTIVKVLSTPEGLRSELDALGWDAEVGTTGEEFVYATVRPRPR
jgi:SAM-dependent methyltransferase